MNFGGRAVALRARTTDAAAVVVAATVVPEVWVWVEVVGSAGHVGMYARAVRAVTRWGVFIGGVIWVGRHGGMGVDEWCVHWLWDYAGRRYWDEFGRNERQQWSRAVSYRKCERGTGRAAL